MANKSYLLTLNDGTTKRVRTMAEFDYAGERFFLHLDLGHRSLVAVSHCRTTMRAFTLPRYSGLYNLTLKPYPTDIATLVEKATAKFDSMGLERVRAGIERAYKTRGVVG
jgi:hypothetical protein